MTDISGIEGKVRHAHEQAAALGLWPCPDRLVWCVLRNSWYEYWAEGIGVWFYGIGTGRSFPRMYGLEFETREAFAAHDPLLAGLLAEWFPAVSFPKEY